MVFYAGHGHPPPRRWRTPPWWSSPTATTWTTSSSAPSRAAHELLRQPPVQADSRAGPAREAAASHAGGVIFTTIQKFLPDERATVIPCSPTAATSWSSPTKPTAASTISSTASPRHMRDALPNASFIGFTGTPIELSRPQHPRRLRRLHQHLRHPAGGRWTAPRSRSTTKAAWPSLHLNEAEKPQHRPGVRGGHRGRGGRAQGAAQEPNGRSSKPWSAPRTASTWSPRTSSTTLRSASPPSTARP